MMFGYGIGWAGMWVVMALVWLVPVGLTAALVVLAAQSLRQPPRQ